MSFDTRVGLALAVALPLQLLPWAQMTRHHAVLQWSALAIVAVWAATLAALALSLSHNPNEVIRARRSALCGL